MALPAIAGDTLPEWVVREAGVLPFEQALTAVHEPTDLAQAEEGIRRLKFDEAFGIQLAMVRRRRENAALLATPRPRRVGGLLDAFDARRAFQPDHALAELAAERHFRERGRFVGHQWWALLGFGTVLLLVLIDSSLGFKPARR